MVDIHRNNDLDVKNGLCGEACLGGNAIHFHNDENDSDNNSDTSGNNSSASLSHLGAPGASSLCDASSDSDDSIRCGNTNSSNVFFQPSAHLSSSHLPASQDVRIVYYEGANRVSYFSSPSPPEPYCLFFMQLSYF